MHYEKEIADNVYDYLMQNTQHLANVDMVGEFPHSWVDYSSACVYLAKEENTPVFKIRIEKV